MTCPQDHIGQKQEKIIFHYSFYCIKLSLLEVPFHQILNKKYLLKVGNINGIQERVRTNNIAEVNPFKIHLLRSYHASGIVTY